MSRSPLFGRRIHISGSIASDVAVASSADVADARALVKGLVEALVSRGATFVLPVDAEKTRAGDGAEICFDWLVWQTLAAQRASRPADAPEPLAVAIEHHKTEEQIPPAFEALWDELRGSDQVQIENVAHWNMNSKRMEAQARWGDILVALGGGEGVQFLANLYHDAGKPVVPLNLAITGADAGARRLFAYGLAGQHAGRLFQTRTLNPTAWLNRINTARRTPVAERVAGIVALIEALEAPRAFVVRLLNPDFPDFAAVEAHFRDVVRPIVEDELGYRMTVVDGRQPFDHARIDQEIFAKLHRSSVVLADITGMRPNCFLELGYAFGRALPTMVMVKDGAEAPFDIYTFAGLRWKEGGTIDDRREAFRLHWSAIRTRPPLVPSEPLIP
jgi:hypothetical protein